MDGMGPRGAPRPDMYHSGKSHEELKAMTDAGEPAVSQEIADQWRSMGEGLAEAGDLLARAVSGSESGWTGMAADAMRYRLGQVADWSMSTGQGFTAASSAVGEQSGAVGEAKTRMPEPVPYDPAQIINEAGAGGLPGIMALPQKLYAQQQKHNAAHQEAVLVVTSRDMHLAKGATVIPEFTMPPALNDDGGNPPPAPDDERGGGPPGRDGGAIERLGSPDSGPSDGPSSAGGPDPTAFGQTGTGQTGFGQTPSGQTGSGQAGPGQQVPGLTTPGSDTSASPGGRPLTPVGGPGPGSLGGPGTGPLGTGFLPGGGFGSGGGGVGNGGGPRGSGPGAGGGPGRGIGGATGIGPGGAGAESAASRGAAAGARGGAGMGGVPMGAGRGQNDEDTEHQRPSYLEEPDPESIFGTDEATAPPVLGLD